MLWLGADGRIYFGGFGERGYTGGGLGWYDPKTNQIDGFWKPLSAYMAHYIAPALVWQLSDNSNVRISPGFGLTGNSDRVLLRVGYSYEFRGFGDKVAALFGR